MERGRIFEVKRFAVHDGPGLRTTVFFKGCPLRCLWCHNPEGIDYAPEISYLKRRCAACGECVTVCPQGLHIVEDGVHVMRREGCTLCMRCVDACMPEALKHYGREVTAQELLELVLPDRDFYAHSGGGVTCSGGEPMSQAAFVADFLALCKREGLRTAVDTSGFAHWESFEKVLPYADLFLYDIKHMDAARHEVLTGVTNAPILYNLLQLSRLGIPVEVRMPVLPGLNDDEQNLQKTAEFLAGIASLTAVRPLPYHALAGSKYESLGKRHSLPAQDGREYERALYAASVFERAGLPCIRPD